MQYLAGQDWEQLVHQPNVVTGYYGAKDSYRSFRVLQSLVPAFVHDASNHGPYKLICDDLGLGNLLVRSKDDLTVVGVVDLEWSYVGPAQLFGSAPWWLLQDRLNNYNVPDGDEGDKGDETAAIVNRYLRHLTIFQRVLAEEEEKAPGQGKELSDLVRWPVGSGAMWLHMVLSWGFNDPKVLPFAQLIQHIGPEKWRQLKRAVSDTEELEAFARKKAAQLRQYETDVGELEPS